MQWLLDLDKSWFLRVNGFHGEWGDQLMTILSWKHMWVIYLPLIIYIHLKKGWKYALVVLLGVLVTFALTDLIAARLIKPFFERLRPCHEPGLQAMVHLVKGCGGQFGFVSNHAANHFGLAVFMGWSATPLLRGITKWLLLVAFAVAYSRVYMGVHYPGDVLCGGLLGVVCAVIVFRLAEKFVFNRGQE